MPTDLTSRSRLPASPSYRAEPSWEQTKANSGKTLRWHAPLSCLHSSQFPPSPTSVVRQAWALRDLQWCSGVTLVVVFGPWTLLLLALLLVLVACALAMSLVARPLLWGLFWLSDSCIAKPLFRHCMLCPHLYLGPRRRCSMLSWVTLSLWQ